MKHSFASVSMIMFGLMAFVVVLVFQDITVNNESDYYSLKEAVEASMYEAIDIAYYRKTVTDETPGEIKIVEEKFVANFTRRFVNNTMGNSKGYVIEFFDIMELPPKVSVRIKNVTNGLIISESFDVVNELTGIIEANVTPAITNNVCKSNEKLVNGSLDPIDYYVGFYVHKKEANQFYKLNVDTIKDKIGKNLNVSKDKIYSVWINKVDLNVNGILESHEFEENLQSSSYLMQGNLFTDVSDDDFKNYTTCVNGDAGNGNPWRCVKPHSKFNVDSTCSLIPNFDVSIVDSDGSVYGAPVIKILKSSDEDEIVNEVVDGVSKGCVQVFKYNITCGYSYCSSV